MKISPIRSALSIIATSIVGTAAVAIFGTLFFLGLGGLLAWLSPLTLFQASCIAIGSTVAVSFVAYILMSNSWHGGEYEDDSDDDFEDVFEDEDENTESSIGFPAIDVKEETPSGPEVGRNEPCPCGSGKKYKRCCGA